MEWSLVFSGLALVVSLGTVVYVQKQLDKRELVKWRRETLTKTVVEYIEATEIIEAIFYDYLVNSENLLSTFKTRKPELNKNMNRLSASKRVAEICNSTSIEKLMEDNKARLLTNLLRISAKEPRDLTLTDADWWQVKIDTLKSLEKQSDLFKRLQLALQHETGILKRKHSIGERLDRLKVFLMFAGS
ncbi:hypothetical protein [Rhodococcus sp. 1168]|uniref:hypothetical protein n=1 Tax=Rhodococcus sp. 1168 TaxID=2018041 RepID=UPI000A0A5574|nr:hypothetical protein [Rhodococcus sp. 1168]ORI25600.1 hypothetical protein BJI47_03020 [Rhodococcus sp. 1168]